jgi:hypothetical protein
MDSNHRSPVAIGQVRTLQWRSPRRKYLHSLGLGVLFNAGLPRGTGSSNPPASSGESANHRFRRRFHGLGVRVPRPARVKRRRNVIRSRAIPLRPDRRAANSIVWCRRHRSQPRMVSSAVGRKLAVAPAECERPIGPATDRVLRLSTPGHD